MDGLPSYLRGMLILGKTHATRNPNAARSGQKPFIDTFDGVCTDLSGLHFQIALG